MKNFLLLLTISIFCFNLIHGQGLVNPGFENFSCQSAATRHFYDPEDCGLTPWKVSHGSPDINYESNIIPGTYFAFLGAGTTFLESSSSLDWGSEGIYQDYNFYKGNIYHLQVYVSTFGNNRPGNDDVDEVFIALANGLTERFSTGSPPNRVDASYEFPSYSGIQKIWSEKNSNISPVQLIDIQFVANDNYSQFWISLIDNDPNDYANGAAAFIFFFCTHVLLSFG